MPWSCKFVDSGDSGDHFDDPGRNASRPELHFQPGAGNHARQLRRVVDNCTAAQQEDEAGQ